MIFLVGRGGNRIDTGRMTEHFVFRNQRCGSVLRQHESRIQSTVIYQKCRQAAELGIDQAFDSPLGDVGEFGNCNSEKIHGQSDRLTVEVAAQQKLFSVCKNQRIVGG